MAATIGTRLHTMLRGKCVGEDEFGNRYFEARREPKAAERRKRWVVYNGMAEPSKVPAHWHGWLHYTHEKPPVTGENPNKYTWQKGHLPNLTGTKYKYVPKGNLQRGEARTRNTADYVPWTPE